MGRWRHGIPVFMYRRVCLRSIHSFEVCGLGLSGAEEERLRDFRVLRWLGGSV